MRPDLRWLLSLLAALCTLTAPLAMLGGDGPSATDRPDSPPVTPTDEPQRTMAMDALLSGVGTAFVENAGQVSNPEVLFYAQGGDLSIGLTRTGMLVSIHEAAPDLIGPRPQPRSEAGRAFAFKVAFEGCNWVTPVGVGDSGFPTNFYRGNDPGRWVTGARGFSDVVYRGIYDGVDLRFHFREGALKYDLVVSPGGDPSSIVLAYEGIEGLDIDPVTGDLLIGTAIGTVRDTRPVIVDSSGMPLSEARCRFELAGAMRCGFHVDGGIDACRPFIIDPGLVYSTYVGGSGYDGFNDLEIDDWGNYFASGVTDSPNFPFTVGEYIPAYADVIVIMMDSTLSRILFSTFISGSANDDAYGMTIAKDGLYLVGYTGSDDFPVKGAAISSELIGGGYDGFIVKMANNGTLLYGSYFGGRRAEFLYDVDVAPDGSPCMYGYTNSTDLPCTGGAFCGTYKGRQGEYVGFVLRLDASLAGMAFCSYVNHLNYPTDFNWGSGITVDGGGNILVCGITGRDDLPGTSGAYCSTRGGFYDGVIMKLNPMGTKVLAATYMGGSRNESVNAIWTAPNGSVYAVGHTDSNEFPRVPSKCETVTSVEGFLVCLDADLSHLRLSCLFGGKGGLDIPSFLAMRPNKAVAYATGYTTSALLPCTPGCVDPTIGNGWKLFLAGIDINTGCCTYVTYLGVGGTSMGDSPDSVRGLVLNSNGEVCVVGGTQSRDFPTTPGAWSTRHKGGQYDGFLMVVDPRPCLPPDPPTGVKAVGGERCVRLTWDAPSKAGAKVLRHCIYRGENASDMHLLCNVTPWDRYLDTPVVGGTVYYYQVSAVNSAGEGSPSAIVMAKPVDCPSMPQNLTWTSSNGTVDLRWDPPSTDGGLAIRGYEVHRGTALSNIALIDNTVSCSYKDTDVVAARTYIYEVRAFNSFGAGPESRVMVTVGVSPPSPPRDLSAFPSDERVLVTWRAPLSDGGSRITGFRILRGSTPVIAEMGHRRDLSARTFAYVDPEVQNGETYYYCVQAVTDIMEGAFTGAIKAVPCAPSTRPLELTATPGQGEVSLSWKPPADDNGKPILGYYVYFGQSPAGLSPLPMVGDTGLRHTGLIDGITYYYEVTAVNEAGQSLRSNTVMVTPMGVPGRPEDLSAALVHRSIELRWYPPSETGGAVLLNFRIYRGPSEAELVQINEVRNLYTYIDETIEMGQGYLYAVAAVNPAGQEGPWATIPYSTITAPEGVDVLTAKGRNGFVDLSWLAPGSTGGTPIEAYFILRGLTRDDMREINWTNGLGYRDTDVRNGQTYHYQVVPRNSQLRGPVSDFATATPLDRVGTPLELTVSYEDGRAKVLWLAPAEDAGRARPTGYVVMRGTTPELMFPLAELGSTTMFLDDGVMPGLTYYYAIVAKSAMGDGDATPVATLPIPQEEAAETGNVLIVAALVALVAVAIVAVAVWGRRRAAAAKGAAGPEGPSGPVAPWRAGAAAAPAAGAAAAGAPTTYIIEEAFVVYRDGRLIASCGREECRTPDADLMSGMLIAIQGIIQDGLVRGGELENIRYGDNLVMMSSGPYVNLAVSIYGEPGPALKDELDSAVMRIETAYAGVIEDWTGDLGALEGIEALVMPLVKATEGLTREGVKRVVVSPEVSLLSALDFHQGYVRLKLAVVNTTQALIADSAVGVEYDTEMLRMERVEPESLRLTGDRVAIGNVGPGDRKTVAFYFDPQICQGSHIDGFLTYVDVQGERHRVEMKRRTADVVCPIFFTREHANTAMLRRLVKDTLKMTDLKVFRYPAELGPEVVLTLGKAAMGGTDVQLVREYVVRGPPFNAEVWYYGETKVHGYRIVIRLGVIEERGVLEMFAASTAMEPVTGLLAELRRELDTVMGVRYRGEQRMDLERDEELRKVLEDRELLLDLIFDEAEGRKDDSVPAG